MSLLVEIKKQFGDFTLEVGLETGDEVLGLLGASGSGKSMTLRCIAGIVTPDSGKIVLNGRTLFDSVKRINLPPQKRNVGLLFQSYALFPNMTVAQNIAAGVRERGERARQVAFYSELLRLGGLEARYPRQLSGGQQQRVALARMMAGTPELLLLDEPFSALDGQLRQEIDQEFGAALGAFSGSVVFVSHSIGEVYRYCAKTAIISAGTLLERGETAAVFARPGRVETARLLCCKNILEAQPLPDGRLAVPGWGCALTVRGDARDCCALGVYEEDVELSAGAGENCFAAQVEAVSPRPRYAVARLRPVGAESPLLANCGREDVLRLNAAKAAGETVWVHLPPEKLLPLRA